MREHEGKQIVDAPELSAEERLAMLTEQLAERDRALEVATERLQKFERQHEEDLKRIKELEKVAMKDPLTDLYNRRGGMIEIERILSERRAGPEKERRAKKRNIAVLALDIDHFGKFNKMYGQDAGDAVLQEVAQRLQKELREDDRVIRMGGEEITVVLPGVDGEGAYNFLFRKYGNADRKFESGDHPPIVFPVEVKDESGRPVTVQVTFSGGIADWKEGASFEETQKIADNLLRKAKTTGRNRILKAEKDDVVEAVSFPNHGEDAQ